MVKVFLHMVRFSYIWLLFPYIWLSFLTYG
jgi:hypothetical protein